MDATISLAGKGKTGTVDAQKMTAAGECLLMDIETSLGSEGWGDKIPYEKCRIYLHGSVDSIRNFAEKIIAALPDKVDLIPFEIEHADAIPHLGVDMDAISEEVLF